MNCIYNDYEFENRVNNLAWTISGNYNEEYRYKRKLYIKRCCYILCNNGRCKT